MVSARLRAKNGFIYRCIVTPHAYNPVIQALLKKRRVKEAMHRFREMEAKNDPPDAISYKVVFQGLCNGGGPIGEAVDLPLKRLRKVIYRTSLRYICWLKGFLL